MLNEQPEVFPITAESDPELWDILQRPEDRRRTYNEDEIPGADIQRIFEDLPEQLASEPLPWRSTEAFDVYQRLGLLEAYTDRSLLILKQDAEQKLLQMRVAHELLETRTSRLERQLEALEEVSEPAPVEAPIKVRVARFALLLVAIAALALFVGADQGKIRASITPEGLALLAVSGTAFLAHRNLED